ncbi:MAG: excisionase [Colwellia sp.]|nr:excisionase [Colwellia sp.]
MNWVVIKKFSNLCGLTEQAIRANIKKGKWLVDTHFTYSPDGRIYINIKEVEKWIVS